jgi:hypothetical protein
VNRKTVSVLCTAAVAGMLIACGGTPSRPDAPTTTAVTTEPAATAPTTRPATPTEAAATSAKKVSAEERNAIGTATDYLNYQSFSRKSLIGQLEYEGYSKKVATAAVDSLKVDWNAQAVGAAKGYLESSHFSRKSLIGQLEYEGFTHAQAVHGVNGAGL